MTVLMKEAIKFERFAYVMDKFVSSVRQGITRSGGWFDKFTGDGVMALFGAPVSHEDHAQRACFAALSIQNALGAYGEKIEKDTDRNFFMSAKEAKEYGLIDEVLHKPPDEKAEKGKKDKK